MNEPNYISRRYFHEEDSSALSVLRARDDLGALPHQRRRAALDEVTGMEGFANLVSMLDYVLDTKRKRHITGGLLLSAAALFAGLAITVMSINDEDEIIEPEETDYEQV